jgi:hypothetical protein
MQLLFDDDDLSAVPRETGIVFRICLFDVM